MLTGGTATIQYDPYKSFMKSTTPVGLYARLKWLGQEGDRDWQTSFDNTIALLLKDQMQDGSWKGSCIHTARQLFGLHLTTRYPTEAINKALDWLFKQTMNAGKQENTALLNFDGLPFAPGSLHFLLKGMTLFLSVIFGRENNPEITNLYEELSRQVLKSKDIWVNHNDINNILRALVVHPVYSQNDATMNIVESLSKIQDNKGLWENQLPFYKTVNALAHLNTPSADEQLEKAFAFLSRTQNKDGTWGNAEKEWNTFLVVHAMRNKKILS
jgi:hypothetical protein